MKLSFYRQRLVPRHRFATSQGATDEKESIVVELEHDGITGLGEAIPSRLYGQTLEANEEALTAMHGLLGLDPLEINPILDRILARFDGQRSAVAAVDSCLYDWAGKKLGVPVWRLLGLAPARARTTFTIGIADPEETRDKIREALADGYDAIKVKVGVEHDHDTLSIIRELFQGPLLLDANCAWQPGEAMEKIKALARYRPAMIEQPLPPQHWREMAALRELAVAPIFADESCERPGDVVRLSGAVDGVNIKFTKCGGIREALKMIALARALDMKVMLGCFVSSSLAIAPALAIATLADFVDLDGHLLLGDDPFTGLGRSKSTIFMSDAPGLGVRPA